MAQYLMALLGREHLTEMFARGMGEGPQPGRMGDYVFNQEGKFPICTLRTGTINILRSFGSNYHSIDGNI
jgi:hypothetical protein